MIIVVAMTGSREYTDEPQIYRDLAQWRGYSVILYHGACPFGGADAIADHIGRELGYDVRARPMRPEIDGTRKDRYHRRNRRFVDEALATPADDWRAFAYYAFWSSNRGTRGCHEYMSKFGHVEVRSSLMRRP